MRLSLLLASTALGTVLCGTSRAQPVLGNHLPDPAVQALVDNTSDHVVVDSTIHSDRFVSPAEWEEFIREAQAEMGITLPDQERIIILRDSFIDYDQTWGDEKSYRRLARAVKSELGYAYQPMDENVARFWLERDSQPRPWHSPINGIKQEGRSTSFASALVPPFAERKPFYYVWLENIPLYRKYTNSDFHPSVQIINQAIPDNAQPQHRRHQFGPTPSLTPQQRSSFLLLHELGHMLDMGGRTYVDNADVEPRAEVYAIARYLHRAAVKSGIDGPDWQQALGAAQLYWAESLWNDFIRLSTLQATERSYDAHTPMAALLDNNAQVLREFIQKNPDATPLKLFQELVVPVVDQHAQSLDARKIVATGLAAIQKDFHAAGKAAAEKNAEVAAPAGYTSFTRLDSVEFRTPAETQIYGSLSDTYYLRMRDALQKTVADEKNPLLHDRLTALIAAGRILGLPDRPYPVILLDAHEKIAQWLPEIQCTPPAPAAPQAAPPAKPADHSCVPSSLYQWGVLAYARQRGERV